MSDGPRRIDSIINQLMARRGYAQVESASELQSTVAAVIGSPLINFVRVGDIKRGVVQLYASDSTAMQELTFQKRKILKRLQQDHAAANITDIRMRVAPMTT
jgi:hypothetical protein